MFPTQITTYTADGQAQFTSRFRGLPVLSGLAKSYLDSCQELENVLFDMLSKWLLVNVPTGDQLNQIGALVGQKRDNMNDADYLKAIYIRIMVNKSSGSTKDVLQILNALANGAALKYTEYWPAGFLVEILDYSSPQVAQSLLGLAKSLGVYGVLHFTTWAVGGDLKLVSRANGGPTAPKPLASVYDRGIGGTLISARSLLP